MTDFFRCLRAQSLRTVRLYPMLAAFTALLASVLAVLAYGVFGTRASQEGKQKIEIGLVGDITDSYLGIGMFAVQNFDSSKFYVDFVELDEETAQEQVVNGKIAGYLRIPDGFVDSIVSGENKPITYVTGNSPASLGPQLMQEIVSVVSDVIMQSQNGIYGLMDVAQSQGVGYAQERMMVDDLNKSYVRHIFNRESVYTVELIGVSRGLPFTEYYFCAFLLLLLLLCGTVCAHMLVKTDLSMSRLLYCRGVGAGRQVLAEYLPFMMMLCGNMVLLFIALGVMVPASGMTLLSGVDGSVDWLQVGVAFLPAAVLITALQFFVYELTSSIVSGVLAQTLTTVALAYVSGLFYPLSSLPKFLQMLSAWLPTGVAFSYLSGVITGDGGWLWQTVTYAAALLLLSVGVRRMRLRGGRNA